MPELFFHKPFTTDIVSQELLRCAGESGSSVQKSLALPKLASLCRELGEAIVNHHYTPAYYHAWRSLNNIHVDH
ncbi:hypothetical protein D3C84_956190 [compost metagenome]